MEKNKRTPNENKALVFTEVKKNEGEEKTSYTWVATKQVIDRDGDIVFVSGIDTNNYKNNPVVLFNHDRDIPIGKAVGLKVEGDELLLDVEFSSNEWGQHIKGLVDEGILNAMSINFIVKEWKYIVDRDGFDIEKSELLEASVVTVPANQVALVKKTFEQKQSVVDNPEPENTEKDITPESTPQEDTSKSDDNEKEILEKIVGRLETALEKDESNTPDDVDIILMKVEELLGL